MSKLKRWDNELSIENRSKVHFWDFRLSLESVWFTLVNNVQIYWQFIKSVVFGKNIIKYQKKIPEEWE